MKDRNVICAISRRDDGLFHVACFPENREWYGKALKGAEICDFIALELGLDVPGIKPTPPKRQIREGAYYRRRDGNVVGPAILNKNKRSVSGYIWKVGPELYTSLGEYIEGGASSFDLVCEVTTTDVPLAGGDTSVRMTASDES
jgi:hypothetical protein